MKYKSQKIAYYFFALSMLLLSLQLVYGFIMGFAHMGYDGLHQWIPFNTASAVHKNLLVVWIISGFMGAAYYIIPEEAEREIISPKLAMLQFWALAIVGVIAIAGFHVGWWEGRKFLEIPRELDFLVAIDVVGFILLILLTLLKGKKQTTTAWVLTMGLAAAGLLYLPGMIFFDNISMDSFFRWWVVHLWVEGVWELIMGGILAFLLIKLTGVDREIIEKWLYLIVGLTFLSGILGTGHHYYFTGVPAYWLTIGGIFSALEPLAFLGMTIFALQMYRKGNKKHPNKLAVTWTLSTAIVSFLGAGLLGLAHTLPQVNLHTHGTLITASHGHLAFWGAYGSLVFAMISYAMPQMTGRKIYDNRTGHLAYWLSNIGMLGMAISFAVAGIAQVYIERLSGKDFMVAAEATKPHFFVLIIMATLFSIGITYFIINFIKFGLPTDEALRTDNDDYEALNS